MKKLVSILLFGLFCWPLFFKTFVLVNWIANKNYIETELCVKKEDANNTCKGTCHMNAQLKNTENQSNQSNELPFQKLIELEFSTSYIAAFPFKIEQESTLNNNQKFSEIESLIEQAYLSKIFRPPQFV